MTNEEIEFLWKDIYQINKITNIKRNVKNNEIEVRFETTWEDGIDEATYFDIEDTITMYSDDFDEPNFYSDSEDKFKYRQYMIACGYSMYWKDNPYIDR